MDMSELNSYVDTKMYDLRQSAMTRRCHTVPTIGHQTVGEHSFHVAMLVLEITGGQPSMNLMKAALYHDLAETSTGDVPANTKWRSPLLKQKLEIMEEAFNRRHGLLVDLTKDEQQLLKWADSLELGFYCIDQLMYGNKHVIDMYDNIVGFLRTLPCPIDYEQVVCNIFDRLENQYVYATR